MKILKSIRDQARMNPEVVAFTNHENYITYLDLWEQSDQLASSILNQRFPSKNPILVYGHMEPEMLVAFLAAVKAGHPYIPIDISIPMDRIKKIAENAQSELMINVSNQFIDLGVPHLKTINYGHEILKLDRLVSPNDWVKEGDTFYIIYTSGSTGNPKGVQISSANLQSFVDWMISDFTINKQQMFLNQAPFSFDLSVMDLYPSLVTGGTLTAVTKDMVMNPKNLFDAFKRSGIQVWTSTPSFVQMCLMDPSFSDCLLPSLETFLFCGEVLPLSIVQQLIERFPQAKLFNTYGPTEATVAITSIEITHQSLSEYSNLPVGQCKKDTHLLIVDEEGKTVQAGEKGEIVIVGPSVSKGYLGEATLTEKSFYVKDGFMAYKTGDVGYMQDGLLFCIGRLDFQIKLHGYRMELEEIEQSICRSKYVERAVVSPICKENKIDYLLASIVPVQHSFEKEYQLTSAIKKELSDFLPSYMIPRKFSYREAFPITINGKLDRKRLKEEVSV
jgi:D-alanine--poly(phosphoribitol) ligase subunit 1